MPTAERKYPSCLFFPRDSNAPFFPSRCRLRSRQRVYEDYRSLCDRDERLCHSKYTFLETPWSGKYQFGTSSLLESPDPYPGHAIKVLTTARVSMLPLYLTSLLQIIRTRPFNSHPAVLLFFYIDCDCDGLPAPSTLQHTPIGFY